MMIRAQSMSVLMDRLTPSEIKQLKEAICGEKFASPRETIIVDHQLSYEFLAKIKNILNVKT